MASFDPIRYIKAVKYTIKGIRKQEIVILLIIKAIKWFIFFMLMYLSYYFIKDHIKWWLWVKNNLGYFNFLIFRVLIFYAIAMYLEGKIALFMVKKRLIKAYNGFILLKL